MKSEILQDITNYIDFLREKGYLVSISCFEPVLQTHLPTLLQYEVHLSPICSYLKSNPKTIGLCSKNKERLEKKNITEPYYSCCFAGVEEFVVPIIKDNNLICCVNVSGYRSKLEKSNLFYENYKSKLPRRFAELYSNLKTDVPDMREVLRLVKPLEYMFVSLRAECIAKSIGNQSSHIYENALRYIYDNYMNNFTLEDMAKSLNYSPSYLRHAFRNKSGKTLASVINSVRLSQAKQLLLTTDLSITYIGTECGFCDGNYFSTVFKKKYGITPKQFRKQEKNPPN